MNQAQTRFAGNEALHALARFRATTLRQHPRRERYPTPRGPRPALARRGRSSHRVPPRHRETRQTQNARTAAAYSKVRPRWPQPPYCVKRVPGKPPPPTPPPPRRSRSRGAPSRTTPTLTPTPITTCAGPPASARSSISTPPSLRSSNQISFGHFSLMPRCAGARQSPGYGDADSQAQCRQGTHHVAARPPQRHGDAAAKGPHPAPAQPPPPRVLKLRHANISAARRRRRAAQQARIGRSDLEQQFEIVQMRPALHRPVRREFGATSSNSTGLCQTVAAPRGRASSSMPIARRRCTPFHTAARV